MQDLFGLGRLAGSYNPIVGTYDIEIHESNLDRAIEILGIPGPDDQVVDEAVETEVEEPEEEQRRPDYWKRSIILSVFWAFGVGSLLGIYFGIRGYNDKRVFSGVGIAVGLLGLALAIAAVTGIFGDVVGPLLYLSWIISGVSLVIVSMVTRDYAYFWIGLAVVIAFFAAVFIPLIAR